MISIKDYKLLFPQSLNVRPQSIKNNSNKPSKFSKIQLPFKYLYPQEYAIKNKYIYRTQKQQLYVVVQYQNYQECLKMQDLISFKEVKIFSTIQQIYFMENRNPNSQKRFIVIASLCEDNTLKRKLQQHFYQGVDEVPDQSFCTFLIQKLCKYFRILQIKGINLKLITLQHIILFDRDIYLNFPFPHDVFGNCDHVFRDLQHYQDYCSPQILKIFNSVREKKQIQAHESQKDKQIQLKSPTSYTQFIETDELKEFKKSFLYSLALSILFCFNFQIKLEERYNGLRNPKYLNQYLDQLRKYIKSYHQGKFISKLLKLMLQHSESLRDTMGTFLYKMNSVQFQLLKKVAANQVNIPTSTQNIPTQSQINQSRASSRISSGKKTIDIRISAVSNTSSAFSKSFLSSSQQNIEKTTSPSQINKYSFQQKYVKNKKTSNINDLNQIQQIQEQKHQRQIQIEPASPGSVINVKVDWDQESQIHKSFKKSRLKASSYKQITQNPNFQLLNKISQKEEIQEVDGLQNNTMKKQQSQNKKKQQLSQQKPKIRINRNSVHFQSHLSRTQIGKKHQKIDINDQQCIQNNQQINYFQKNLLNVGHKHLLGSDHKIQRQNSEKSQEQNVSDFNFSLLQSSTGKKSQILNTQENQQNGQNKLILSNKEQKRILDIRRSENKDPTNQLKTQNLMIYQRGMNPSKRFSAKQNSKQQYQNLSSHNNKSNSFSIQPNKQKSGFLFAEMNSQLQLKKSQSEQTFNQPSLFQSSPQKDNLKISKLINQDVQSSQIKKNQNSMHNNQNDQSHHQNLLQNSGRDNNFDQIHADNQSVIFEQNFNNIEQQRMEQILLKQSQKQQKRKLRQRKKDQYNQRSKVIIITLVMIYCIFQTIQWIIEGGTGIWDASD